MDKLLGKHIILFYLETNGQTFKKSGKVVSVNEGLLILDDIKEGRIVIPISRIGKMEVLGND